MFKILIVSLLLFLPRLCYAQQNREQLYAQLAQKQVDTARLNTLYKLGLFFLSHYDQKNHLDSAEVYFNKALVRATTLRSSTQINSCNLGLGQTFIAHGNLSNAENYYNLVAGTYGLKHETIKQAETWLQFGNVVLDKLSDTGKRNNELAAKMADKFYDRGTRLMQISRDTLNLINIEMKIAIHFGNKDYIKQFKDKSLAIIKRYENSGFTNINMLFVYLSEAYRAEGNYNISLYYILKTVNRMNRLRDTINRQVVYGELALNYDELGQAENAVQWYRKTLALRENIPNLPQAGLYLTAGFLALNLNKLGRSAEALNYINGLEKTHPPKDNNVRGMAAQVKAYCYDGLKQYTLSEKFYLQMMAYYKITNMDNLPPLGTYDIAKFYIKQKKYRKAAYYLKDVKLEWYDLIHKSNIELMLFKIDSAAAKPWSAIRYFQKYKYLNDSIFTIAKSGQIEELQIRYSTDQKENDLASVKKDRQLQYEKANQATVMRNITFIGISLLLMLVGLLYKNYKNNKKKTLVIDLKNKELNHLVNEKDGLLEEKEWLIREVHHRVKNNLQIVMGLLQRQSSFINNEEALTAIRNSEYRMYSIALIHHKLYQSDSLMLVSMAEYINEMIGYLVESFDLGERIRFETRIAKIDFEVNLAVPIGLILNEAITNSIKYACTDQEYCRVKILLKQSGENEFLLEITDNGHGLPADFDAKQSNSMGFNLMRGLSKQIGGVFSAVNNDGLDIKVSFRKTDQTT